MSLRPNIPGTDRRVQTVGEAVRLAEHLWRNGAYETHTPEEVVTALEPKLAATDAFGNLPDWPSDKREEFTNRALLVLRMPSNRPDALRERATSSPSA